MATPEQLASMSAESLLDLYQRRLGDVDDLVVAVVGDVDAEVVERLARHYIGTLPAGDADTYVDRHRPFPEGVTRRDITVGPEMSAILEISHEAELPVTPSVRVNAHMLRVILDRTAVQADPGGVGCLLRGVRLHRSCLDSPAHGLLGHRGNGRRRRPRGCPRDGVGDPGRPGRQRTHAGGTPTGGEPWRRPTTTR